MYEGKNVLVTGATGMIGSHLCELLFEKGAKVMIVSHIRSIPKELSGCEVIAGDLTNPEVCRKAVKNVDYVFHLAAFTGGLGRTSEHPAITLTPNLIMDGNMLEAARKENVDRFLYASCSCIYPNIDKDLSEEDAWSGPPPEAHASYSWAKRMGELQAISYHKEFGMKIGITRPSNSYGPRDNFDPKNSHVIAAFIGKAAERRDPFVIWGDGSPIREFIFAKDAAKGILIALEKNCNADPMNLASGEYFSIRDLAFKVSKLLNYSPKIVFDNTKPNGQRRRVLRNDKAERILGFKAETTLERGLKQTIDWYETSIHQ